MILAELDLAILSRMALFSILSSCGIHSFKVLVQIPLFLEASQANHVADLRSSLTIWRENKVFCTRIQDLATPREIIFKAATPRELYFYKF